MRPSACAPSCTGLALHPLAAARVSIAPMILCMIQTQGRCGMAGTLYKTLEKKDMVVDITINNLVS